jgi:hypothetical protein
MSERFKVLAICPHGLQVEADAEVGEATRDAIIRFPVCDHPDGGGARANNDAGGSAEGSA